MSDIKYFLEKYKWRILSVAIGIVLTVLLLTIGFWRTLLLLAIVAGCYFVGTLLDSGGKESLKSLWKTLLKK